MVAYDRAVSTRFQPRLAEIRLGLTRQVPYALLFCVLLIDDNNERSYGSHDQFARELLAAVPASDRSRLSGLGAPQ